MLDFTSLQVRVLPDMFSVCQLSNTNDIPFEDEYVFVAKTDNEISLVCRTKAVPDSTVNRVDGFRAMRIVGVLELSQVGVVSRISSILTEISISIFVVSTYDTDYILLKEDTLEEAENALREQGYDLIAGELFPHWYKPGSDSADADKEDENMGAPRRNGFLR